MYLLVNARKLKVSWNHFFEHSNLFLQSLHSCAHWQLDAIGWLPTSKVYCHVFFLETDKFLHLTETSNSMLNLTKHQVVGRGPDKGKVYKKKAFALSPVVTAKISTREYNLN